jgi:cold shock CspA family protein
VAIGRIVRLAKEAGYGFVEVQGKDEELIFHWSALSAGTLDQLAIGQLVSFEVVADPRDAMRSCAMNLHLVEHRS